MYSERRTVTKTLTALVLALAVVMLSAVTLFADGDGTTVVTTALETVIASEQATAVTTTVEAATMTVATTAEQTTVVTTTAEQTTAAVSAVEDTFAAEQTVTVTALTPTVTENVAVDPKAQQLDPSEYDPDDGSPYKYYIEIEFGALQFYYDWGEWSPAEHAYKASDSSAFPANGTEQGKPGWYGFDGTNNKISISNGSVSPDAVIGVSVSFRAPQGTGTGYDSAYGHTFAAVDDFVEMALFRDEALTDEVVSSSPYAFFVAPQSTQNYYVSFANEPFLTDSGGATVRYDSQSPQAIGFLTVRVFLPEPSLVLADGGFAQTDDPAGAVQTTAQTTPQETTVQTTPQETTAQTTAATETSREQNEETTTVETSETNIRDRFTDVIESLRS